MCQVGELLLLLLFAAAMNQQSFHHKSYLRPCITTDTFLRPAAMLRGYELVRGYNLCLGHLFLSEESHIGLVAPAHRRSCASCP